MIAARNFVCLFFQRKSVEALPLTFLNFITAPNGRLILTGSTGLVECKVGKKNLCI